MNIRFYKGFSKRKNSTKQPGSGITYADYNCVLKNPTAIENPTIVLSGHPETKTVSGNPITITDGGAGSAQSLTVDMLPIQDLHGYDKPWAGGSGKNKFDVREFINNSPVKQRCTVSVADDDTVTVTSTETGGAWIGFAVNIGGTLPTNTFTIPANVGDKFAPSGTSVMFYEIDENDTILSLTQCNIGSYYTVVNSNCKKLAFRLIFASLTVGESVSFKEQIEKGETATSYEPYSNICPISGCSSLDVTVNGETETLNLGQTVYGGTCDVVNGGTSDLWVNIPSYSGETLGTEWYSSLDEPNTPPTIGAQVVYKSNQAILTPATTISLNKGNNTLSTSGDNMSLTYLTPGTQLDYDYAYIDNFKRYYSLRQTTILSNNHIQYELEEDAMASKKTAIGATVAHIAYAATGWDKWLIDSRLSVKTTKNINSQVAASGLSASGMYVVAIINDRSATKLGACTFYMMTETNMNNLAYNLSDQGIITDLRNIFNNPLDSIVKAVWIPLAPTSVPQSHYDNAELVYAGSRALNLAGHECYGAPLKDFVVELPAVSLLIPDKHQDFRDASPFTTGSLYLPGLGLTDLNMSDFIESDNVNIKTYIDITTGDITYRIYEDNGHILKTCIFNGATEIPLAHVTNNAGGTLASIGGVAGGAITAAIAGASGNLPVAFGGIATALASGTSAVMQSAMRATSIKGGIAGRSAFYDVTFKLLIVQLDTEDPDDANYIATFGRPVGVAHAISSHSGYVQCDNASVVMSGSVLERDRINDYLNTGFFYE